MRQVNSLFMVNFSGGMPPNSLTFLTTSFGKPFTGCRLHQPVSGFTNRFRQACNAAGLPKGTSPHGLRKAAARRLASEQEVANLGFRLAR
jgi:integrase